MRQNLGDLRLPAAAIDARHQFAEPLWLGDPSRCAAFGEPSVIDELKIESADGGRFPKHFCLELTRLVPSRLPAHCGVEREDEPPSLTGFDCGIERSNPARNASMSARDEAAGCCVRFGSVAGRGAGSDRSLLIRRAFTPECTDT